MPTIGAIRIEGINPLPPGSYAGIIEAAIGKSADPETLQQLTSAIAEKARAQGYIFASATIPPQDVRIGVVTVNFDPGRIVEVRIEGSINRRLRALLAELIGPAPRRKDIERQLLLAEDLPGITINRTRFTRENGNGILLVEASEQRATGNLIVDNWGTQNYGPVRARIELNLNRLASDADSMTIQAITTFAEPEELTYGSMRYTTAIGASGAQLGLSIAGGKTRPGEQAGGLNLNGKSRYVAVFASAPIRRSQASSLWLNAEFAYLRVEQEALNALIEQDDITTFTVSLNGAHALAGGRLNWGAGAVQGLSLLGASKAGESNLSRLDGSGVFTKGFIWFNWFGSLNERISLRLAGTAQLASRGLLSPQEITLGGPYFGRGYDFGARGGDDGLIGLVELRHRLNPPLPSLKWAHAYAFVDGGYIANRNNGWGSGSLFSAGGGVRAGLGEFELGIEGALPLKGDRFASGDKSPQFNLLLGYGF